jgi:glycosyltransferase involved in cell wall biosynthesis
MKVLLVPDAAFWVTGMIAKAMAAHPGVDALVCSEPVLNQLLDKCDGRFPLPVDVVHFLTPHCATRLFQRFSAYSACVATIHHVEDEKSIEPASYVDAVTTGCEYWRDYHGKNVCDPAKVVMVHYGLDTELYRPASQASERDSLRRRHGIAPDRFVVGFSAKRTSDTSNRKGLNVLEALMGLSTARKDGITWVVRGPGWQSFVDKLRGHGAEIIYLSFLPEDSDVAESYRMLDAFVVTARIEGGPYPLVEAMSSGVPVVSTPVGLALEVVKDGETGFTVPFDDPGATYDRLLLIRSDAALRERLVRAGRRIICDTMTWEKALEPLPELYRVAIANFRRRTAGRVNGSRNGAPAAPLSRRALQQWIDAREFAAFSEFLAMEHCDCPARHFANRAIRCAPFDRGILRRCAPRSTLGLPYRVARRLWSKLAK